MQNRSRLTIALLGILAATIVRSAITISSERQRVANQNSSKTPSKDGQGVDFETQFPLIDFEVEEPFASDKPEGRKSKNRRYDKSGLVSKDSSPEIDESVRDIPWQKDIRALPTGQSAAIVIGGVQDVKAYLSDNKSGVYTEVIIHVEEVLKNDTANSMRMGQSISADRPGGRVRYPNGHTRLYRIFGMNMPRVGRRYVLFLGKDELSPNYRVLTGYELRLGEVIPLDIAPHFDTYKGMDEATFLEAVRAAIM